VIPSSIPPFLPRWLERHPILLAAAVAHANRLRRLGAAPRRPRAILAAVALGAVGAALIGFLLSDLSGSARLSDAKFAFAAAWFSSHAWLVIAASTFYAASLVARKKRMIEDDCRTSWLAATPLVEFPALATTALLVIPSLLWRLMLAIVLTFMLSRGSAVFADIFFRIAAFLMIGTFVGALIGWRLPRRRSRVRAESSRYVPRSRCAPALAPSAAALSRWPVTQALAWSRPENARLILLVAILTVPGGSGLLLSACILGTWFVGSYLAALLIAVPRAAQAAVEWLRSTPIGFWAFAWPLARRALAHQLCGTAAAVIILLLSGAAVGAALYAAALWFALVLLATALTLADCYRARSPVAKTTLSVLAALLLEQRARGWGIALALSLAAWQLQSGKSHARA
jgi:hypothetical protein